MMLSSTVDANPVSDRQTTPPHATAKLSTHTNGMPRARYSIELNARINLEPASSGASSSSEEHRLVDPRMCVCDSSFIVCIGACEVLVFGIFASFSGRHCNNPGKSTSVIFPAGTSGGTTETTDRTDRRDRGDLEVSQAGPKPSSSSLLL
mmetsp:Transcript_44763/g.91428  ORF Transcript_44763/g.91428 Transcript_44763/m.91428 type:complete len:150 (-) Transcript_44763:61-510(-)